MTPKLLVATHFGDGTILVTHIQSMDNIIWNIE